MLASDSADILERRTTLLGQMESITAAIFRVVAPFQKASALQLIQQRYEPARRRPKHPCQRLLCNPGRRAQDPENAGMRGSQLEVAKALREPGGGMSADLG
jgi:hypothetical protein